jgi:hypothetical protein
MVYKEYSIVIFGLKTLNQALLSLKMPPYTEGSLCDKIFKLKRIVNFLDLFSTIIPKNSIFALSN